MIKEIKNGEITWLNIVGPNKDTTRFLREKYDIAPSILKEFIPPIKRPKVEDYRGYLFVVIHFPVFDKKTKKTSSVELDIILFKNILVTSHCNSFPELRRIFNHCQEDKAIRDYYLENDAVFSLYRILDKLIDTRMPMLDHIDDHIDEIEKRIFDGDEKKLLKEIAFVKHDIIGFRKAMKPQRTVLESLARSSCKIAGKDYPRETKEVIGSNIKVWNTLENHKEMIEALEQTNESLFSHKLNDTMRVLTAFSVMVLPLSLIANAFGMNVIGGMPLLQNTFGFWIIIIMMLSVTLISFLFFKYKKWI
ncbi:MAG: magnesium transporter CorA family protein [Candidatus Pacebacteria bacterium]|nr:magnesium transporter CorA family protein [Candidatus Paceibacterota bacterium]